MSKALLPSTEHIEASILLMRGHRVIIDADLARFYDVTTKRLNEQVRRNRGRFPADFMFQLSPEEKSEVVANCDHLRSIKYSPVLPYVFTEHGAQFQVVFGAIRQLMNPEQKPKRRIGFEVEEKP